MALKQSQLDTYFVLDCESIGLHGETFAVGWVVVDETGTELEQGYAACYNNSMWNRIAHAADPEDIAWIEEHVLPVLPEATSETLKDIRDAFWQSWMKWKDQGAVLVADCSWPVEANFLSSCVKENVSDRKWTGPYPLHEVATALLLAGMNSVGNYDRLKCELPKHHPVADARQSARLWLEAMSSIRLE